MGRSQNQFVHGNNELPIPSGGYKQTIELLLCSRWKAIAGAIVRVTSFLLAPDERTKCEGPSWRGKADGTSFFGRRAQMGALVRMATFTIAPKESMADHRFTLSWPSTTLTPTATMTTSLLSSSGRREFGTKKAHHRRHEATPALKQHRSAKGIIYYWFISNYSHCMSQLAAQVA